MQLFQAMRPTPNNFFEKDLAQSAARFPRPLKASITLCWFKYQTDHSEQSGRGARATGVPTVDRPDATAH